MEQLEFPALPEGWVWNVTPYEGSHATVEVAIRRSGMYGLYGNVWNHKVTLNANESEWDGEITAAAMYLHLKFWEAKARPARQAKINARQSTWESILNGQPVQAGG